ITYSDIPVNNNYIDELAGIGIVPLRESKWLNGVSARVSSEQLSQLGSKKFIYKVRPVAGFSGSRDLKTVEKKLPKDAKEDSTVNIYNYGSASRFQIEQVFIHKLHNRGYTGRDVLIGLLDTGVKVKEEDGRWVAAHEALADINIVYTYSFIDDTDYVGMLEATEDELIKVDHGTKMLGLLGAYRSSDLVSPAFGADYMLFETEDPTEEVAAEEDNWIRACEVAESLGVDIISSSLGYKDWYPYSYMTGDSCLISIAADIAASKGVLVVNAMGNINENTDSPDTSIIAPADADSIISVGGVDDYNTLSPISATGPAYDRYIADSTGALDTMPAGWRIKPEVLALSDYPYTVVTNNDSMYNFVRGTSGATAIIAGGCALLLQAHPQWSPMDVRNALTSTAYPPFVSQIDSAFRITPSDTVGFGIADFESAVMFTDSEEIVDIETDEMLGIYPNPASIESGHAYIPFKLIHRIMNLKLEVYTLTGKKIYHEEREDLLPGVYTGSEGFVWDLSNSVSPGTYIVIFDSRFVKDIKKITIIP
ncbi:MAG: S8 family serine peptidase, partial [candidate division WOR-3 bacterium]|nr:S8 family serine peptidase [candidate division WOR-3 bacterium]